MLKKNDAGYGIFLIGPTGKIITWNTVCERILGYSENDILLRKITSLLPLPARKMCQDRLSMSRSDAEKLDTEIIHADGHSSMFNLTFVPQFRKSGKFSGFSVIAGPVDNNISEKTISERDLIGHTPLKEVINFLVGTFYVINQAGKLVMWNKKVEEATQMKAAELKEINALDLFSPDQKKIVEKKILEVFEHDGEVFVEADLLSKNGVRTPYIFTGSRFKTSDHFYLVGMGLDISVKRQQEQRLRLRERALHASSNGIVITRCAGRNNPIEYVNPAFERITGYQAQEVIGRDSRFMAAPGMDILERAQLKAAIHECKEINVIFRNLRKNGELFWNDLTITPVWDESGVATHFIGVLDDVTLSKHRTSHLEHAVNHDVLTGLANRNLLWDRLEQALHVAQRNKTMVATVMVDLDNFKAINDTMGHDAGDEVLRVTARRLKASVRESDTVARLGGDEFVLVLSNQPTLRYTLRMIERLRQDIGKAVIVDEREIAVESSMGVSIFPHDGSTVCELMQAADVAMYHAKSAGRNDVHFFSPDMKSSTDAKHKLEVSMRDAINKDEIFLEFQPKMDLKTGRIVGAEALLRWRHPDLGVLLASSFISEAEESGLIIPLGEWEFNHVCTILQRFKMLGFQHIVISMNVSFQEFSKKNYVGWMAEKLNQSLLPAEIFELEIKEVNLMRCPQLTRDVLAEISQLGIKLTVDEFGSDVSSLSNLKKLPINHLKISKSFIESIGQDSTDVIMAKTIIGIGHNMNIDVVAAGVETRNQLNFLQKNDCDQGQGNYFSKPVSLSEFEQLLIQDAARNTAGSLTVLVP
jgi:diguanylate cyclase (GGDEF)-like protein/PAS domain S-box-containing protein